MRTLNLGILAHVDAGKTSLTERLLYAAGVIDRVGRVDDGDTQTDTLALERERGITIKSAVVSFVIGDVTINLIDTPGHPDFIAEVERVLGVLDGAVLVISAVEGVQSQSRVLMRTLRRLRIPTILFINKIDRAGAHTDRVLEAIAEKLTPSIMAMGAASGLGTRDAAFAPHGPINDEFQARLATLLAEHDDAMLAAYVGNQTSLPYCRLRDELASQTGRALVHPVFFGSAITGSGVDALSDGICELLPAREGDADGDVSGTVFKIERGDAGEKIAYARMFSGAVHTRDRVRFGGGREAKVTAISVFEQGSAVQRPAVSAGQIAKLWGLADVQIGDAIGAPRIDGAPQIFSPPTLETVVVPRVDAERGALRVALDQLAEQDPLISLRQDDVRQELHVSLYGEVQKEVIHDTLAAEYGIDVGFRETTTICIERPSGSGGAVEMMRGRGNPFLASVGLRIEPAAIDSGIAFQLADDVFGTMPLAFFVAVEDTVRMTLGQGLHGWQVTDCLVTMTHSGYAPRQSHAHQGFSKAMSSTGADFRGLTPLVVMAALREAGTTVFEPMHRFRLEIPADTFGAVMPVLTRVRACAETQELRSAAYIIDGTMPAARVHELHLLLPSLTRGEGVLESSFECYAAVDGTPPSRPRTDNNPIDRKEYLLHVMRRV